MPFLLHSHSMTSVKRASSFHENSHSTRTRSRVSRKPVILNVSRFSKRMSPATQEKKKILHGQHAWRRLPHATRLGKQTRQAGRSGLTTVTSVCLQSGSVPGRSSFFYRMHWKGTWGSGGLRFQTAFFYLWPRLCLVHLFYHATLQGLETTSFLDRNLRFHCHMYCCGVLANWEWSNSPLSVTSICSLSLTVSLSWGNWAYSYVQSKHWPWILEWILGLSGTSLWQYWQWVKTALVDSLSFSWQPSA